MANGKGSKQRVRWSKSFEMNFNKIFKKNKKESNKNVSSIKDINT